MRDPHLNLFYSYQDVVEDNVTRALVVTLSELSSVYQRLVLRKLFLPPNSSKDIELFERDPLQFDLQVHAADSEDSDEEDLLTQENGALVGLHHAEHESDISSEDLQGADGASRIDALIEDPANDLTVVIEVKLGSTFSKSQLDRHHQRFFDTQKASFDEVFQAVRWTELVGFLDNCTKQGLTGRQQWVLEEFVQYADMVGVSPFLGFDRGDFGERDQRTLQRFVAALERKVDTSPSLVPHGHAKRLDFDGIDPNLWVDYRENRLELGLVCGVEKKRYAREYRDALVDETEAVGEVFATLAEKGSEIEERISVVLHPRARFFGTRVQRTTIRVGEAFSMPAELSTVRDLFADQKLNPIGRISREEITRRFEPWLGEYDEQFGPDGLFMRWPSLDEKGVLTTLYFHSGYQIPADILVGMDREETLEYVTPLIEELAGAAEALSKLRKR